MSGLYLGIGKKMTPKILLKLNYWKYEHFSKSYYEFKIQLQSYRK